MEEAFDVAETLWDRLERRQFWPTVTTNNFGSSTTVTIYGTLITITSWSSPSTIIYATTEPTATSYSTATPALTTIFTPPASCLSQIVANAEPYLQIAPVYMPQCYPYGYATSIFFSPGVCPSGYAMATLGLRTIVKGTSTVLETAATCCPRGYTYTIAYGPGTDIPCASAFNPPYTSGTLTASATATSTFTITLAYLTPWTSIINSHTVISTISSNTVVSGTYGSIRCASIQVRWQSTDMEILSLIQLTGPTTSPTTVHPTSIPTHSPKTKSNNTGKIVAGVLVPILVIALMIAAFFWLRRRRRHRKEPGVGVPMVNGIIGEAARVPHEKSQPYHQVGAVPQYSRSELNSGLSQSTVMVQPGLLSTERAFESPVQDQHNQQAVQYSATISQQHHATSLQPNMPFADPNFVDYSLPIISGPVTQFMPVGQSASSISPPPTITSPVIGKSQDQGSPLVTSPPLMSTTLSRAEGSNLQSLQAEYTKVVEERARLSRLQELTELESKLKGQIEKEMTNKSGNAT